MKIFLSLFFLWGLLITQLNGEEAPLLDNSYQGIEPGARITALGGAFCNATNDPSIIFWNPAGLVYLNGVCLNVMISQQKSRLLNGNRVSLLCLASDKGGVYWRPLALCQFDTVIRISDSLIINKKTHYQINEYGISFSRRDVSYQSFSWGVNLKYINARLSAVDQERKNNLWQEARIVMDDGNGFGVDIGVFWQKKFFDFALSCQNLFGRIYWNNYKTNHLVPKLRVGWGVGTDKSISLAIALEKDLKKNTPSLTRLGLEWSPAVSLSKGLHLRAGIYGHSLSSEKLKFSGGLGYTFRSTQFDFSWTEITKEKWKGEKKDFPFRTSMTFYFR